MISGCVVIDLSLELDGPGDNRDRTRCARLDTVPAGARVVVNIGDRRYPSQDAAYWLRRHSDRLHIEIQGSPDADVAGFVRAARAGDWAAGW